MMVAHGTVGKGDVHCITIHCPPSIGKATEPELRARHTYVVILVSLYCT